MKVQLLVTAVALAVAGGILVIRGLPPGVRAQHAIVSGDEDAFEGCLKWGTDSNAVAENELLLHSAAFFGRMRMAELLIEHGADVNARSSSGMTPVGMAAVGRRMAQQRREAHEEEFPARVEDYDRVMDLLRRYGAKE